MSTREGGDANNDEKKKRKERELIIILLIINSLQLPPCAHRKWRIAHTRIGRGCKISFGYCRIIIYLCLSCCVIDKV